MAAHKLADGPVIITVATVTPGLPSKYNPEQTQVRFTGEDGTDVYLNEVTAQKQLDRIKLDYETVVGKTIHIEQVKKNGTTFTNINFAPANGIPNAASPARQAADNAAPKGASLALGEIASIYGECVSHAMVTLGAKCEEAGIPVDAAAVNAAAATILIQYMRGR